MASYKYQYSYVDELDHSLICSICFDVAKHSKQHEDCGKIFCSICIDTNNSGTCPCCRGEKPTYFLDKFSDAKISNLAVNCDNRDCKWQGTVKTLEEHIQECIFTLVCCPNKCGNNQPVMIMRKDLEIHLDQCPNRIHQCMYCGVGGKHYWVVDKHTSQCEHTIVECPNKFCTEKYKRACHFQHLEKCDYTQVPCQFDELGCTVKKMRKDISSHEDNEDDHHLEVASLTISQLTKTVQDLRTKIKAFEELGVNTLNAGELIRYKVENYSRHKEKKTVLTFKPFYCWPHGYKLQMKIYFDGIKHRPEDSGYISILFYLLRGYYDQELDWPFKPTIKASIFNPTINASLFYHINNYEKSLDCDDGLKEEIGWGHSQFISHKYLDKTNFISNDAVIFQISIERTQSWLVCNI